MSRINHIVNISVHVDVNEDCLNAATIFDRHALYCWCNFLKESFPCNVIKKESHVRTIERCRMSIYSILLNFDNITSESILVYGMLVNIFRRACIDAVIINLLTMFMKSLDVDEQNSLLVQLEMANCC